MLPRTPYIKPTFKLILESAQQKTQTEICKGLLLGILGQPRTTADALSSLALEKAT